MHSIDTIANIDNTPLCIIICLAGDKYQRQGDYNLISVFNIHREYITYFTQRLGTKQQ